MDDLDVATAGAVSGDGRSPVGVLLIAPLIALLWVFDTGAHSRDVVELALASERAFA